MNWLCAESAAERFGKQTPNCYYPGYDNPTFDGVIHLTRIDAYLHEYFHHIDFTLDQEVYETWQAQAFADLGRAQSQHGRHVFEWPLLHDEQTGKLFLECFGREYRGGLEDYYDAYDLYCYSWDSYELNYANGRAAWTSFTHYLLDLYGENTVVPILLFPETVETATGKTWEELEADWRQHMEDMFKDFEIQD